MRSQASVTGPGRIFFFNDTATTEIYTLSLHDALPISPLRWLLDQRVAHARRLLEATDLPVEDVAARCGLGTDRKSTRLNSSHANISYAVFCLKKKKTTPRTCPTSRPSAESSCDQKSII